MVKFLVRFLQTMVENSHTHRDMCTCTYIVITLVKTFEFNGWKGCALSVA